MSAGVWAAAILACGLGATLRYLLARLDPEGAFPWPTVVANALGSMILGCVAAAVAHGASPAALVIVGSGFAGGLTTFSTLAVDAVTLLREGRLGASGAYLAATLAVGLAGAGIGWVATAGVMG
ncbi:CrcB family protein [Demequina sp. NBRC 110053]|uniref:fluoride efflux transporter FluC n=1 Tax=Demequina sp. NBRC 110053 TaxID=1570342 RepID=UPI0013565881|nr:CrcB family protein [Demequina sp. NBRC 110053]